MAVVYRAGTKLLRREVAVKCCTRTCSPRPNQGHACNGEARAVAKLNHDGSCRFFDYSGDDAQSSLHRHPNSSMARP